MVYLNKQHYIFTKSLLFTTILEYSLFLTDLINSKADYGYVPNVFLRRIIVNSNWMRTLVHTIPDRFVHVKNIPSVLCKKAAARTPQVPPPKCTVMNKFKGFTISS